MPDVIIYVKPLFTNDFICFWWDIMTQINTALL